MDGWTVLEWAAPIIGAVVVWALGQLSRWLASRTANERLRALLDQVEDAAATAVLATQQAFSASLKAADRAAGGRLTPEQGREALTRALSACKTVLGTKGLDALRAALGVGEAELEAYLTAQIEASLGRAKGVLR